MSKEVSLLVSVPSCRDWKPQFGTSLVLLAEHLVNKKLGGRLARVQYSFHMQASCLSSSREYNLLFAENEGFTHWLSLDDDMVFPCDVVDKLIAHNLPVVVANYRRKQVEIVGICLDKNGEYLDSTGKTGIEEVTYVGGGCNLVEVAAVKAIVPPRFSVLYVKEKQSYMSEDYFFSMKLQEHGIKMYCDHDVSNEVKHVGDVVYTFPKSEG